MTDSTEVTALKKRIMEALDVAAKETSRLSTELNFFNHNWRAKQTSFVEDEIHELHSRVNDL